MAEEKCDNLRRYGPMDHDVTRRVLAKFGAGMAVVGQLVDARNQFCGFVALHLKAGGDWVEITRANNRKSLLRKLSYIHQPKEGIDENLESQAGNADPKPR